MARNNRLADLLFTAELSLEKDNFPPSNLTVEKRPGLAAGLETTCEGGNLTNSKGMDTIKVSKWLDPRIWLSE